MIYLNGLEAQALVRAIDGLSDQAIVQISQEDSFGNVVESNGIVRVRVYDPGDVSAAYPDGYVADDAIGPLGMTSSWLADEAHELRANLLMAERRRARGGKDPEVCGGTGNHEGQITSACDECDSEMSA